MRQQQHQNDLATKIDEAIARDAEMKALEEALAKRILEKMKGTNLTNTLTKDLSTQIAALKAYHDTIRKYEAAKQIVNATTPTQSDVAKALEAVNKLHDTLRNITSSLNTTTTSLTSTKSTSLLQLEEQGVPVYVQPTLVPNEVKDADLLQRNYIIDGVNGIDFTQISDEIDDSITLQVNGVPVTVNPVLMRPTGMEKMSLGQKMRINLDEVSYVQQKSNPDVEDTVTLQVEGVPVTVNPVLMRPTGMERANMGEKIRINLDYVNFLQTGEQNMNPVRNPPFNNWSVNQPSPPHQHGMKGNEDLGMRDIIIDGVNYDLVQTNEKGVPVYVQPTLLKNEAAEVDLKQRNYVIEGVDGFAFTQIDADGVPVYVKPKLLKNEMADYNFNETMVVGGDKIKFE